MKSSSDADGFDSFGFGDDLFGIEGPDETVLLLGEGSLVAAFFSSISSS